MLNKTLFALAAVTVLATSSTAFASYTGYANRGIVIEPSYTQTQSVTKTAGHAVMARKHMLKKQALKQTMKNKI